MKTDSEDLFCGTVDPPLSDHSALWALYLHHSDSNRDQPIGHSKQSARIFRSVKINNILYLRSYFLQINIMQIITSENDLELAWEPLIDIIANGIEQFCPLVTVNNSRRLSGNINTWYTPKLKN